MMRNFLTIAALAATLTTVEAQGKFKFGVHIDPTVTFLGSNDKAVTAAGSNLAFRFGMQGDIYMGENGSGEDKEKGTYAITFGVGFIAGAGGTLQYRDGGRLLPNSELDKTSYTTALNTRPTSGENLAFGAATTVKYSVNYVPISAGFKITTAEFGDSYIRAFFHLPTIDILIPVSARGAITAGKPAYGTMAADSSFVYAADKVKGENILKDIVPIQFAAGVGAGVEWSPNSEGGIRLIGGIYYSSAVLDMNKKVALFDPLATNANEKFVSKNPRSAFQGIALRIGVVF
jgi:hypothetical protein